MYHNDVLHWNITNLLEIMVPSSEQPTTDEKHMQHVPEASNSPIPENKSDDLQDFVGFDSTPHADELHTSIKFDEEEDTNHRNDLRDFYGEKDESYRSDTLDQLEVAKNLDLPVEHTLLNTVQDIPKNLTILLPCKHVFEYTDILPYLLAVSRTQIHSYKTSPSFSFTCPTCKSAYQREAENENRPLQEVPPTNYIQTTNPPAKTPLYDIFPTAPLHLQADGCWYMCIQPSFWGGKAATFARLNIEEYENMAKRAYEQLPRLLTLQRIEQRLGRVKAAAEKGLRVDLVPAKVVPCEVLGELDEGEEDLEGRVEEARAQVARMLIMFAEHGGSCLVGSAWEKYVPTPGFGGSGWGGWI